MTNREIENKIKAAVEESTPDVFDSILQKSREQRGTVILMKQTNNKSKLFKGLISAAAALLLVGGLTAGFLAYQANAAVRSTVMLDVNPSIEIKVNKKERVIDVNALNDHAKTVIGDMDLDGSDLDVAVNAIIGSMLKNGYLSEIQNSILVSVDSKNEAEAAALKERLSEEIAALLKTDKFEGAVLSQSVENSDDLTALSEKYSVTSGKAQLINRIIEKDSRYTFEELAPLSINELNLLAASKPESIEKVDTVGKASEKNYIGADAAKTAAFNHAGVKEADIRELDIEMDYENGTLVYEIEFEAGKYDYEYDINAKDGAVVKNRKDIDDDGEVYDDVYDDRDDIYDDDDDDRPISTVTSSNPAATTSSDATSTYIGRDKAIDIALKAAGVSKSDAIDLDCEFDEDDERYVYEVDFEYKNVEYKYEINAKTGAILDSEKDIDD